MFSVAFYIVMLSVVMLNVVMLGVVAPSIDRTNKTFFIITYDWENKLEFLSLTGLSILVYYLRVRPEPT